MKVLDWIDGQLHESIQILKDELDDNLQFGATSCSDWIATSKAALTEASNTNSTTATSEGKSTKK